MKYTRINGRDAFMADDETEAVAGTAELLHRAGAKTFEIRWDSPYLASDDDEVPPGVPAQWTAIATFPGGVEYRGQSEMGTEHGTLAALACVDLLTKLGVRVAVLDLRETGDATT